MAISRCNYNESLSSVKCFETLRYAVDFRYNMLCRFIYLGKQNSTFFTWFHCGCVLLLLSSCLALSDLDQLLIYFFSGCNSKPGGENGVGQSTFQHKYKTHDNRGRQTGKHKEILNQWCSARLTDGARTPVTQPRSHRSGTCVEEKGALQERRREERINIMTASTKQSINKNPYPYITVWSWRQLSVESQLEPLGFSKGTQMFPTINTLLFFFFSFLEFILK